jgi:hypothetical protein
MPVDPSRFHPLNVADTCSVWNVLSSVHLYRAALQAGCSFCCTTYVEYECLHKPRKRPTSHDEELRQRLTRARAEKVFTPYALEIADLQTVQILESRKRLSKGELSSIAFATRTRQAFLTDDLGARKLAEAVMDKGMVQTTPHLFGWLIFTQGLSDGDKHTVISAHSNVGRPLAELFELMYSEALRCLLMAGPPRGDGGGVPPAGSSA